MLLFARARFLLESHNAQLRLIVGHNLTQYRFPLLLAHPASAGHGLNLQAGGSTICWYGLNWSLELYAQFNARLHRQGQTKPVVVHHIVAQDTIDNTVLTALAAKDTTQKALLDAVKNDMRGRHQ